MKSLFLIATIALASAAAAAEPLHVPAGKATPIADKGNPIAPEMNLYSAAPEPSHAMLLMMGLVGLAVRRRR